MRYRCPSRESWYEASPGPLVKWDTLEETPTFTALPASLKSSSRPPTLRRTTRLPGARHYVPASAPSGLAQAKFLSFALTRQVEQVIAPIASTLSSLTTMSSFRAWRRQVDNASTFRPMRRRRMVSPQRQPWRHLPEASERVLHRSFMQAARFCNDAGQKNTASRRQQQGTACGSEVSARPS